MFCNCFISLKLDISLSESFTGWGPRSKNNVNMSLLSQHSSNEKLFGFLNIRLTDNSSGRVPRSKYAVYMSLIMEQCLIWNVSSVISITPLKNSSTGKAVVDELIAKGVMKAWSVGDQVFASYKNITAGSIDKVDQVIKGSQDFFFLKASAS